MDEEVGLANVLGNAIENSLADVYTAMPGKIVTIRNSLKEMTVDVQPIINTISEDGEYANRPVVYNVPVQFPSSSTAGITFPVVVGDSVLLVFSMRGIDSWKYGDGSLANPVDYRMHSIRDCIAIPGIFPTSKAIQKRHSLEHDTNDTVMFAGVGSGNETEVRVKPSGEVIINAPVSVTVNTNYAEVNAPNSKFTGNVVIEGTCTVEDLFSYNNGLSGVDGDNGTHITGSMRVTGDFITTDGYTLRQHRHSGVQAGGDDTGSAVV